MNTSVEIDKRAPEDQLMVKDDVMTSTLTAMLTSLSGLLEETVVLADSEGFVTAILAPGQSSIKERCELNKALDAIVSCELESCRSTIAKALAEPDTIVRDVINSDYSLNILAKALPTQNDQVLVCLSDRTQVGSHPFDRQITKALLGASDQGIAVLDSNFTIQSVNRAFCRLLDTEEERAIGRPPFFLDSLSNANSSERIWRALSDATGWKGEFTLTLNKGNEIPVWLSIESIRDHETKEESHLILLSDISEQYRDREKMSRGALSDSLTGIHNREAFFSRLHKLLARNKHSSKRYALISIDIDHFQNVNDAIGYELSNKVLIEIAERLKRHVGEHDFLARIGGDEFAIMFDDMGEKTTLAMKAKALLGEFATPIPLGKYMVEISICIGACIFPSEEADNATEVMKQADTALYTAKRQGNNSFRIFSAAQSVQRNEFFQLEMGLRQAQALQQLSLAFQPQYEIRNNHITGAEVFTRWNHPILGPISPSRFIPVAEKSGYIDNLGDWVLSEAIAQMGKWRAENTPYFTLSINLSRQQLINPDIAERIKSLIKEHQIPADMLEFELTEQSISVINNSAKRNINAIKALGCRLALDDFGSSGANLNNLRLFEFDRIKIDQTFIAGIPHEKADTALVKAALVFAKSMGITAIAEGVETEQQAKFLMQYGCSHQQGYLYSQAVNANDYRKLLT